MQSFRYLYKIVILIEKKLGEKCAKFIHMFPFSTIDRIIDVLARVHIIL